jgi:hypothetical protein
VTALDTPDRDRDGSRKIVIGTEEGSGVEPGDGGGCQPIGSRSRIDGLAVRDLTETAYPNTCSPRDEVFVFRLNPARWRSGVIGPGDYGGVGASLIVGDVDDDGRLGSWSTWAQPASMSTRPPIPVHACLGTAPRPR